ncbi:MAG TPA: patatin-like phospholipase family protein [Nitrososphaera sp.]|nr:patatin-like phospholipase family protein [Nitrososphaera sp.]
MKELLQGSLFIYNRNLSSKNARAIPARERALVLQGGGALGAYEVGAYKALYEFVTERDEKAGNRGRPAFDIIAGTSIGAMNSAVLTSYVVENGTYEGSVERLLDFWNYLSKESNADTNPFFKPWWDHLHNVDKAVASGEAARRYYSSKEFAMTGVPHVFSPLTPMHDRRFFDFFGNTWYRFSNEPLRKSLERFVKFPIATSYEDNQPRLLLVAVDVADGAPVVFDSYAKEDGSRKSEYGRYITQEDGNGVGFEHRMKYDDGITVDHVLASGCYPVNFDFTLLPVESYSSDPSAIDNDSVLGANSINDGSSVSSGASSSSSTSSSGPDFSGQYRKEIRRFWDGGMLTNTPLTQLVLHHRRYWYRTRGLKDKVPSLAVAVINVHPTRQAEIPTDHDGVVSRNADITFSDRSHREQEVLLLISDYVDLVKDLIKIAKDNGVKEKLITDLLNKRTKYHGIGLPPRLNKEIVEGVFDIEDVYRIERTYDENTISEKVYDFSVGTVQALIKSGYEDSLKYINAVRSKIKYR